MKVLRRGLGIPRPDPKHIRQHKVNIMNALIEGPVDIFGRDEHIAAMELAKEGLVELEYE